MSASFWWVNHSDTVRHEIEGSYLWFANKARKSKARSESDKNIQRLLPGDTVYSFADGAIGAIGVVQKNAFLTDEYDAAFARELHVIRHDVRARRINSPVEPG